MLAAKAKALRATVRSTAAGRRKLAMDPTPGFNNYQATTEAVRRAHACHARRACFPRAPNRHTSHTTTLPGSIGAHAERQAAYPVATRAGAARQAEDTAAAAGGDEGGGGSGGQHRSAWDSTNWSHTG